MSAESTANAAAIPPTAGDIQTIVATAVRPASASAAVAVRRWTPLVKAQSMPDFRAFGRFTAHRPDSARESTNSGQISKICPAANTS